MIKGRVYFRRDHLTDISVRWQYFHCRISTLLPCWLCVSSYKSESHVSNCGFYKQWMKVDSQGLVLAFWGSPYWSYVKVLVFKIIKWRHFKDRCYQNSMCLQRPLYPRIDHCFYHIEFQIRDIILEHFEYLWLAQGNRYGVYGIRDGDMISWGSIH